MRRFTSCCIALGAVLITNMTNAEEAESAEAAPAGDGRVSPEIVEGEGPAPAEEAEQEEPGDVTTEDEGSDPCAGIDCSGHGRCSVVEGNALCDCDAGFIRDNDGGLQCVEGESSLTPSEQAERARLCAGVTCGGHGTCAVVRQMPVCRCESGYMDDVVRMGGDSDRAIPTCVAATERETEATEATVTVGEDNPEETSRWRGFFGWGIALTVIGGGGAIAGGAFIASPYIEAFGAIPVAVGVGLLIGGIVMIVRGRRLRRVQRTQQTEVEGTREGVRVALSENRLRLLQCFGPPDSLPAEMVVEVHGVRVELDELNPPLSHDAVECIERELSSIRLSPPNYTGFRLRYQLESP